MLNITKKQFAFGDMVAVFATIEGATQLILVPNGCEDTLNDEKIAGVSPLGCRIDNEPMIHVALTGDGYARDFTSGATMRNSDTAFALRLVSQELTEEKEAVTLVSRFENGAGLIARQYLVCGRDSMLLKHGRSWKIRAKRSEWRLFRVLTFPVSRLLTAFMIRTNLCFINFRTTGAERGDCIR